jgi:hypothetical protein
MKNRKIKNKKNEKKKDNWSRIKRRKIYEM